MTSGDIFGCHIWVEDYYSHLMVGGARDTAKKILRCPAQPSTKNYLLPNANSAEVEGTWRPRGTTSRGEIKVTP